jgi:mannosyltransferase
MEPSLGPRPGRTASGSYRGAAAGRIVLAVIVALGVAVRLKALASKPFWFDECFSVEAARISAGSFLRLLWWREANMSLYYACLRLWLHWGQSPFFIRSLSVVFSAGSVVATYWLGRLLYNRRIGLGAAALLAANVYAIRYAQEARSYALFLLLATLSSAFFIAWIEGRSRLAWRGYVLASILAAYAHFYALLLVLAHGLVVRWSGLPARGGENQREEPQAHGLGRAWISIGIAVLPLLVFVAKTGAGPIRWIRRPGLADLFRFSLFFTNGWPVLYLAAAIAALLPWKNRLAADGPWPSFRARFLLVGWMFPILLTLGLSLARPVFLPRYLIFCLPPLLILVAAGTERTPQPWLRILLLAGILGLSARMIPYVYGHDFDDERDASGEATRLILDQSQPGDAILFHIAEARVPYEFFRSLASGQNTASPAFTARLGPEIVFPHHGPGLEERDFTGKPTAAFLRSALPGHTRVWVLLMNNGSAEKPDPTTLMLNDVLPEMFPQRASWQFARVEVRLYSR